MNFFEVIKKRKTERRFQSRPVQSNKIEKIISAAESAPSAGNLKAYKISKITDDWKKEKLADAAFGQSFVKEAPVALVFFALPEKSGERYGKRGQELYSVQDATIAAAYAQLAATATGLVSCWVGAFDEQTVKNILGEEGRPIAIITIGYK